MTIEPFDLRQPSQLRPRRRPPDALVHDEPRVDQEGRPDGRAVRVQQPVGHPVDGEAHVVLRHDASRHADPGDVDRPAEGLRVQARPRHHAVALRPAVRPRRGRRGGRLPAVRQAVRRWRMGRCQPRRRRCRPAPGVRRERHLPVAPATSRRAARPVRAVHRVRAADPTRPLRPSRSAARSVHDGRRCRPGRPAPDAHRHDVDDQLVLRVGVQLVRGAAPGRHLAPDRLRQRLSRLPGDVAALPLPVARGGQPAVVDLLRGDEAPDADQPRLGAVLRDRRLRRAVRRQARRLRGDRPAAPAGRRVRVVLRDLPAATRSGRAGSSSPPRRPTTPCARRWRPSSRSTRSTSSPICSGPASSSGATTRQRASEVDVPKTTAHWYSERVERDVDLVRWGSFGTPVLVFPTAGGDAEEIERFHLVDAVRRADRRRPGEAVLRRQRQRPRPAGQGGRQRPAGVDPAAVLRLPPP